MPAKPKIEYRLVCAGYGDKNQIGHGTHEHGISAKATPKQREQRLSDINHHYQMLADRAKTPQAIKFNNAEIGHNEQASFWTTYSTDGNEAAGWAVLMPQMKAVLDISQFSKDGIWPIAFSF